jgi:hypothetical protein
LQHHIAATQASAQRQPALKAKYDDMAKRLNQLVDRLAKPSAGTQVSPAAVGALTQIVSALNAHDTTSAQSLLVQLSTGTSDVGPSAVIGLKHLIALSKP